MPSDEPHVIGYLCPSLPDGPLIPPSAFTDPYGGDKAVWSDGTMHSPRWRLIVEVEGPRESFGLDTPVAPLVDSGVSALLEFVGEGSTCVRVEVGRIDV